MHQVLLRVMFRPRGLENMCKSIHVFIFQLHNQISGQHLLINKMTEYTHNSDKTQDKSTQELDNLVNQQDTY